MITFTPYDSSSIKIGGDAESGAFPKYGIQREISASSSEGGILNSKYSITISGNFVVPSNVDITDVGARQSKYNSLMSERLNYLKALKNITGKLEITPYGGKPGKIIFNDAKLISINVPESPENSSAILHSEYSITFEAYIDASIGDGSVIPAFDYNGYLLSSVEENWSVDLEDTGSYLSNNPTGPVYKNYTITHTVSATGIRKAGSSGTTYQTTAWKEAQRWVNSRLLSSPFDSITKEMLSTKNIENAFNGRYTGDEANNFQTSYEAYLPFNHVRVPSLNFAEGSYSVTESWSASRSNTSIEVDINADVDQNETVTINVEGTITGFDESNIKENIIKKIENAESAYASVKANAYNLAVEVYNKLGIAGSLSQVVRSSSMGKNKKNGTITFNFSYNDLPILLEGAKNTSVSINDDNEKFQMEIIAIIQVIARQNGPIIQKMKTSKERRRSVQLDAIMDKLHRQSKPDGFPAIANYVPRGENATIQNYTENWEPAVGNYSLSVEWVY